MIEILCRLDRSRGIPKYSFSSRLLAAASFSVYGRQNKDNRAPEPTHGGRMKKVEKKRRGMATKLN